MKTTLRIFVKDSCPGCVEARKIAAQIEEDFPQLTVEIINLTDPRASVPEPVFATPTYMLGNRIVSLGNPSPTEVAGWAASVDLPPL